MGRSVSRKRPWLAALLGAVATGFGHLYLRRWRRGLAWVGVLFGVIVLFVDPAAIEALANWHAVDPLAIAPILVIGSLNAVDAYLLAHAQNAVARLTFTPDGQRTHCPNCGKELDSDLAFCHWCTTEIGDLEAALPNDRNERDER
ncbi:zinc ribbon domain-containing protein [Haloarcula sp. JP-Z28]|uniref:zinc ribbon domain-containing protein n=1 Tax=Haloarcula sp. JP-Z28 TaxID=2716715 RepID=UPI001404F424|nr:zinc ribbon domain-containing protein [Haloarcula sp. JP-Z28]NHN65737.1 zinc ribbon domain-containing protein [Haloarcula sp. JP-Z28]